DLRTRRFASPQLAATQGEKGQLGIPAIDIAAISKGRTCRDNRVLGGREDVQERVRWARKVGLMVILNSGRVVRLDNGTL
ncbi:hypothetical protein AbraIFM66950_004641, partial [Aspergillus brasiliensis]